MMAGVLAGTPRGCPLCGGLKNCVDPDRLHVMKRKIRSWKLQLSSILIFFFAIVPVGESCESGSPFQSLIRRLTQDGFEFQYLSDLLTDARAELNPSLVILSFEKKEMKELYAQFLSPDSVLISQKFLRENLRLLKKAEDRFGIEREVIVAILCVESRFGENIGKFRVILTLATIALTDSPDHLQKNYLVLREKDPELSYERIEDLAKRKADRAYHELKCFLNIVRDEKIDPLEVYGSYAGALGMAQFVPSSYLAYALNSKSLEHWLLSKEAAVLSIGNYLKHHGWKKNLAIEKKRKVLWCYNHSEPYVETILRLAQKIKRR
jgi:membrane-bound lytic murein transglycosylase B